MEAVFVVDAGESPAAWDLEQFMGCWEEAKPGYVAVLVERFMDDSRGHGVGGPP